eukprot:m.172332 g.172332  ORF g.172332 m.172332 type:complete len:564 (+) comp16516_c2_seq1:278-1969(+)
MDSVPYTLATSDLTLADLTPFRTNSPTFAVAVSGTYGAGKSTVLRALCAQLGVSHGDFKTGNSLNHTTTCTQCSARHGGTGAICTDGVGSCRNDPDFDVRMMRATALVSRVLIFCVKDRALRADVENLEVLADAMTSNNLHTTPPSLVVILRTNVPLPGSMQAYLESFGLTPTLQKFHEVVYVHVPELSPTQDIQAELQAHFQPIIDLIGRTGANNTMTGAELCMALEKSWQTIVKDANIDIPSLRDLIHRPRVQATVDDQAAKMKNKTAALMETNIVDRADLDQACATLLSEAENAVRTAHKDVSASVLESELRELKRIAVEEEARLRQARADTQQAILRKYQELASLTEAISPALKGDPAAISATAFTDVLKRFDTECPHPNSAFASERRVALCEVLQHRYEHLHELNKVEHAENRRRLKATPKPPKRVTIPCKLSAFSSEHRDVIVDLKQHISSPYYLYADVEVPMMIHNVRVIKGSARLQSSGPSQLVFAGSQGQKQGESWRVLFDPSTKKLNILFGSWIKKNTKHPAHMTLASVILDVTHSALEDSDTQYEVKPLHLS